MRSQDDLWRQTRNFREEGYDKILQNALIKIDTGITPVNTSHGCLVDSDQAVLTRSVSRPQLALVDYQTARLVWRNVSAHRTGMSAFLKPCSWLDDNNTQCIRVYILTVKVFLLGSAHFMCGGFAHSLADRRPGHAVLRCCDPIRDRLARHRFYFSFPTSIS